MDRLLSTQEAANRLAVDPKTVVRYVHDGKLTGSRIGRVYRVSERSVLALLQQTKVGSPQDLLATGSS